MKCPGSACFTWNTCVGGTSEGLGGQRWDSREPRVGNALRARGLLTTLLCASSQLLLRVATYLKPWEPSSLVSVICLSYQAMILSACTVFTSVHGIRRVTRPDVPADPFA